MVVRLVDDNEDIVDRASHLKSWLDDAPARQGRYALSHAIPTRHHGLSGRLMTPAYQYAGGTDQMPMQRDGIDTVMAHAAHYPEGGYRTARRLWRLLHWAILMALAVSTQSLHAESSCKLRELAELPVSMHGLRALVPATVNGSGVQMLVDTGLARSMLTYTAVEQLALKHDPSKDISIEGVTGPAHVESTEVGLLQLESLRFPNQNFFVSGAGSNNGAAGLIGQDLLGIADTEYDLANGIIRFLELEKCTGQSPVYWASNHVEIVLPIVGIGVGSKTGIGRRVITVASLNGIALRVMLDTGAGATILSSRAARDAGVTPETPGVESAPLVVGLGGGTSKSWFGTFSSLRIGNEEIKHLRIRFGELNSPKVDMLIGADFFLAHRIIVAASQQTIYATYNGGAVFASGVGTANHEVVTVNIAGSNVRPETNTRPHFTDHNSPTDAASYSRRGMAFGARRDYDHAIADLTHACKLEPKVAAYFFERGQIFSAAGRSSLALADFDAALNLKADYPEALVARAEEMIDTGDRRNVKSGLDAAASYTAAASDLRYNIASLYVRMRLPAQALEQIDLWVLTHKRDSKMPAAQNIRCLTKGLLNVDLDKALQACDTALASQPQNVAGLTNRGLVRLRARQYEAAIMDFDAALARAPTMAVTLYRRGIAQLKLGRNASGMADISAARALDSNIVANEHEFTIDP